MQVALSQWKNQVLRHIRFIAAECVALWKECYFSDNLILKKTRRFWMRVIVNYAESFRYYLVGALIPPVDTFHFKECATPEEALESIRAYGLAMLPEINVDALPFVHFNTSNERPVEHHEVDQNAALRYAKERGFQAIASRYLQEKKCYFLAKSWRLNAKPQLDINVGSAEWHRDRDGYKLIKFFVYLTDVEQGDGEHEYALGTHAMKPLAFVPQIRFSDEEVKRYYTVVKVKGNRGACFAEDTTGLHKASIPINKNRDILVFIYFCGPVFWDAQTQRIKLDNV